RAPEGRRRRPCRAQSLLRRHEHGGRDLRRPERRGRGGVAGRGPRQGALGTRWRNAMSQKTADEDREQRADALIARMKQARGYIYPEWEFAARQDPEFV